MHLSKSFRAQGLGKRGDCPVAESIFEEYVSLPIHPRLTDEAVLYMIDAIREISLRSYVPRSSPTPLLDFLLALSDPAGSDAAVSSACVSDSKKMSGHEQLVAFKVQIKDAIKTGLFLRNPNQAGAGDSSSLPILISRAPGRLDLMGGNDDYTGGLVFECTIAEATFVAAQVKHGDPHPVVVVRNRQLSSEDASVPVSVLREPGLSPSALAEYLQSTFSPSRWQLYVIGVLYWLNIRFPLQMFSNGSQGLSLAIWSTVPLNRGVSSSASVEVAVMKAAASAFGISIEGEALATACQWVENQVCSSACGLMDQMAVTLGGPFMAMRCQPAKVLTDPPLPEDLTIFALDSGVSHEVSGIEYEAARAAAFMGYKIICFLEGLDVYELKDSEIPRFTDDKYSGYLANMSPSNFSRLFEKALPECMSGREFLEKYGSHVDPATPVLPDHVYNIRANTKYAVMENNRVSLFFSLIKGCPLQGNQLELYEQLGELMYQSHDAYTECGLGSTATSAIVDLVRSLGISSGLFGAKITGGGAGGTVAILGLASAQDAFQKGVVEPYAKLRGLTQPPYVFAGSSLSADAFGVENF
jgi:L-arabinokinase